MMTEMNWRTHEEIEEEIDEEIEEQRNERKKVLKITNMLNKANNHIFEKKCNVNEYKMCSKWRLIRTMERGQTEWGIQRVDNEERHEIIWERRRGCRSW